MEVIEEPQSRNDEGEYLTTGYYNIGLTFIVVPMFECEDELNVYIQNVIAKNSDRMSVQAKAQSNTPSASSRSTRSFAIEEERTGCDGGGSCRVVSNGRGSGP